MSDRDRRWNNGKTKVFFCNSPRTANSFHNPGSVFRMKYQINLWKPRRITRTTRARTHTHTNMISHNMYMRFQILTETSEEDSSLLGCDTVLIGKRSVEFWGQMLPPSSGYNTWGTGNWSHYAVRHIKLRSYQLTRWSQNSCFRKIHWRSAMDWPV